MTEDDSSWHSNWKSASELPVPLPDGVGPVRVARSPGRLDLLGGDVAFAGAMALSWPTLEGCQVAVRRARDRNLVLRSENVCDDRQAAQVEWNLDELLVCSPEERRRLLLSDSRRNWTAHLVPLVLRILEAARDTRDAGRGGGRTGLRVLVRSSVPQLAGLASSCALSVGVARALAALLGLDLDPAGLGLMIAEEQGFLDATLTPALPHSLLLARAGHVLPMLCQPGTPSESEQLPEGVFPVAIAAADPERSGRRLLLELQVAAGMAYRIMGDQMGLELAADQPRGGGDPYYGGYLANIDPVTYASEFRDQMPPQLTGEQFLMEYDGLSGGSPRVDPAITYAVRQSAQFVLAEHQRVCTFIDALHAPSVKSVGSRALLLGAQLDQSIEQSNALGLVTRRAAFLARELSERGAGRGVLGVRCSMNQGALVLLCQRDSEWERVVTGSVAAYEREFGVSPSVHHGSSHGAGNAQALLTIDA